MIGIDIGKNTFHVVGLDEQGAIVLRQKWSRGQVEARLANIPPCLIELKACVDAHNLSHRLQALGHDSRPGEVCAALLEGAEERLPRRRGDCRGGPAPHHEVCCDEDDRAARPAVLDASGIDDVDYTAAKMLLQIKLAKRGIAIAAVATSDGVLDNLRRYGIGDKGGLYPTVDAALAALRESGPATSVAPG